MLKCDYIEIYFSDRFESVLKYSNKIKIKYYNIKVYKKCVRFIVFNKNLINFFKDREIEEHNIILLIIAIFNILSFYSYYILILINNTKI